MPRLADPAASARSAGRPRVALFTAARDWHARVVARALKRRGVGVVLIPLEQCGFDTGFASGLRIPGLERLPAAALVRTMAAGSFEAVTRRLGVLHALAALGVPVRNGAACIERCVDKSMTTFLLAQAGLPVPRTWAVENQAEARRVAETECQAGPLVLKPLFGSQGRGLVLVRRPDDLPPPETVAGVYYLQRYVGGAGPRHCDFRVFVIGGEPIAAMQREGAHWITNVKQGGRPIRAIIDCELGALASAAAAAVDAAFCGVDVIRAPDGALNVLEVNSMPAWSGLQTVAEIDIADILVERFCRDAFDRAERRVA